MSAYLQSLLRALWHFPRRCLVGVIRVYQMTLSPDHPPSPSAFAKASADERLRWASGPLIAAIDLYQKTLSPDHGPLKFLHPYGFCRHAPTCSEYGKDVIEKRGVVIGMCLLTRRLLSCHPWKKPSDERLKKMLVS